MQLKQRIKKLEEKRRLTNKDADFCVCYRKHIISSVEAAYHPENGIQIYPQPDFNKEICDICDKTFNPRDVELSNNIELFYGDKQTE